MTSIKSGEAGLANQGNIAYPQPHQAESVHARLLGRLSFHLCTSTYTSTPALLPFPPAASTISSSICIVSGGLAMASPSARTTVNNRGQRTNSLGYAKYDCHTCSALKRACDRQRPRCGPCIFSRERCGGFATNLVWKDVEIPSPLGDLAPGSGTGSPNPNSKHCENEPATKNRGFKFVKGRMKRKRKHKAPPPELELLSPANDTGDSNLNSQNGQPVMHPSPWCANSENIIHPSALTEEACNADRSSCDELASELSKCGFRIRHF